MLQWRPLAPLNIACIYQEITHTDLASPELVGFGVETHSSHPRPCPHSGIGVSSSTDDCDVTRKLKPLSKEKYSSELTGSWFIYHSWCKYNRGQMMHY